MKIKKKQTNACVSTTKTKNEVIKRKKREKEGGKKLKYIISLLTLC